MVNIKISSKWLLGEKKPANCTGDSPVMLDGHLEAYPAAVSCLAPPLSGTHCLLSCPARQAVWVALWLSLPGRLQETCSCCHRGQGSSARKEQLQLAQSACAA